MAGPHLQGSRELGATVTTPAAFGLVESVQPGRSDAPLRSSRDEGQHVPGVQSGLHKGAMPDRPPRAGSGTGGRLMLGSDPPSGHSAELQEDRMQPGLPEPLGGTEAEPGP